MSDGQQQETKNLDKNNQKKKNNNKRTKGCCRKREIELPSRSFTLVADEAVPPVAASETTQASLPGVACDAVSGGPFPPNSVATAEYTWWDFLPRALALQFQKIANVYFSYIFAIMMIGTETACWQTDGPWGMGATLIAVMVYSIAVLAITDCQRRRSDREINTKQTRVFRRASRAPAAPDSDSNSGSKSARFVDVEWGDVKVGDLVLLRKTEVAPCDMVPICCSDPFGLFFVTTTELDGETNRKVGSVAPALVAAFADPRLVPSYADEASCDDGKRGAGDGAGGSGGGGDDDCGKQKGKQPAAESYDYDYGDRHPMAFLELLSNAKSSIRIEAEPPGPSITTFSGAVHIGPRNSSDAAAAAAGEEEEEEGDLESGKQASDQQKRAPGYSCELYMDNVMLRSTSLQNTSWLLGVAVYTGMQSRVMLNLVDEPSKLFSIDRALNRIMQLAAVLNVAVVVTSVIAFAGLAVPEPGEPCIEGFPSWLGKLFTYQTYYQNVIPIAVYIVMETVNILQGCLISHDPGLRKSDEEDARRPQVKNLRVCQEIGMVDFIFSDKTGTLTKNEMVLQKMLVFPRGHHHDDDSGGDGSHADDSEPLLLESADPDSFDVMEQVQRVADDRGPAVAQGLAEALTIMSAANTVYPVKNADGSIDFECESPDEEALVTAAAAAGVSLVHRGMLSATCRVDMPGGAGPETKQLKIVGVHAFDSTRKRMSVVVAESDGSATVFCKGADNIILERVKDDAARLAQLQHFVTIFAEEGLRTLVLATRHLSPEVFAEWKSLQRIAAATPAGPAKKDASAKAAALVESELQVVAVTAIEDKLQDNVPDTLRSLRAMGIRLWVLTGDKLETAISIGFSSRTLVNSDLVLSLDGSALSDIDIEDESVSAASVKKVLTELRAALHEREEDEESDGDGGGSDDDDVDAASPSSSNMDTTAAAARGDSVSGEAPAVKARLPNQQQKPERVVAPATTRRLRRHRSGGEQANTPENDREAAAHQLTLACQELSAKFPCLRVYNTPAVVSDPQARARIRELRVQRFEQQHKAGQKQVVGGASVAVVITGKFLSIAMDDGPLQDILRDILLSCSTVLACRVSPLQKAELVGLVKDGMVPKPTTLAIGDGANDVGMIQRADVGIGIFGREGLQAANISDIAINEFQHLYRILQYHGRGNYRRLAIVIKYCFFKPMVITAVQFIFSWYNGFTGTQPIPAILGALFDVILVLPIAVVGWLDRDIEADAVLRFPQLYHVSRTNSDLTVASFVVMVIGMLWYGITIFYVCWAFVGILERFGLGDLYSLGSMLYFSLILTLNVAVMMRQHTWTFVHAIVYATVFGFFLLIYVLAGTSLSVSYQSYTVTLTLLGNSFFWMCQFMVLIGCLVWDTLIRTILAFIPTREQLVLEGELARVALIDEARLLAAKKGAAGGGGEADVARSAIEKQASAEAAAAIAGVGGRVEPVLLKSLRVRGGEVRSSSGVSFSVLDTLLASMVNQLSGHHRRHKVTPLASGDVPAAAVPVTPKQPQQPGAHKTTSVETIPEHRQLLTVASYERSHGDDDTAADAHAGPAAHPLHFSLAAEMERKAQSGKCRDVGADLMEVTHCSSQCNNTWTVPIWLLLFVLVAAICLLLAKTLYWAGPAALYAEALYYSGELAAAEQPCVPDASGFCELNFVVEENCFTPVQIFYKIEGYEQNRARYKNSFVQQQYQGTQGAIDQGKDLILCTINATLTSPPELSDNVDADELLAQNYTQLYPCGLVATSLFPDSFELSVASATDVCNFADRKLEYFNATYAESQGFHEDQLEELLKVEVSTGFFLRDFSAVLSPTAENLDRFPCHLISEQDIYLSGLADKYQNPPDYPTVLDPSLYYLHQQYPDLVPRELGIQTPRVINWLQPAASPVFKKLYGVLPHGVPAGNLTLRVRLGDTPYETEGGSRLLRKSVVLMAGSAITPEFDAFFHSYSGAIIGMSALFAIIAIVVRVLCPRKLASSSFSVKPIWRTRRGRGRGKKRRRAERKSLALVQKEAAALRQQMNEEESKQSSSRPGSQQASPRFSPKAAAQPAPAPRHARGSETASSSSTVRAPSKKANSPSPSDSPSRSETVAPVKLVPLSESKASSHQAAVGRLKEGPPARGSLSTRASPSAQANKGGKPSAEDQAYAESKAERRRRAGSGGTSSKTHKKKKKKHKRSRKEASTPVVHPEKVNPSRQHQQEDAHEGGEQAALKPAK